MLDHVSLTVVGFERAERFYDAIFAALDVPKVGSDHADAWIGYGERSDADHPERSYFSVRLGPAPDDAPRRHYCFKAPSRAAVQAFWRAGMAHGGLDLGAPGLRDYHANYLLLFYSIPTATALKPSATALMPADRM